MTPEPARIFGIDFTSRPGPRKPIVVATATLAGQTLALDRVERFAAYPPFEAWLSTPGPWVAGFDFPFGLPRAFVDRHLPTVRNWPELVTRIAALDREAFCRLTWTAFHAAKGRRERKHRAVDSRAGSHSPLKTMDPDRRLSINPPVGLMFYEGAPRLLAAGVRVPGLNLNDDGRIALEAYPGRLARLLGERTYKNDKAKHGDRLASARARLLDRLDAGDPPLEMRCLVAPELRREIIADASGDALDALLCAVQAAWGARRAEQGWGLPAAVDPVEGWIVGV
jgi:Protein of unknown function (DUF429)